MLCHCVFNKITLVEVYYCEGLQYICHKISQFHDVLFWKLCDISAYTIIFGANKGFKSYLRSIMALNF